MLDTRSLKVLLDCSQRKAKCRAKMRINLPVRKFNLLKRKIFNVLFFFFLLCRNKNVPVNHRDFWYATYTLYSVSEKTENEEKMSDNASASSGSDQAPSSRQHTMVSFLKPVLKQIIMAGKSMQLLKNLQCKDSSPQQAASRGELAVGGVSCHRVPKTAWENFTYWCFCGYRTT